MNHLRFGHTAITWPNEAIEEAVSDIAACGYWGTETFGWVLEEWESQNRSLLALFEQHQLQLTSLYCHLELTDSSKRQDAIDKVMEWVDLYLKFQGPVVVIGGTMLNRASFAISDHASAIILTLNELAKRITDKGLLCCFHPHTGTAVETEEEIRRVLEGVDSRYVTFAPDVGQIAKGGTDPVRIIQEYYELIRMLHLKDYIGGPVKEDAEGRQVDATGFLGYTPLGMGSVDLRSIVQYLEDKKYPHYASVELDGNQWSPTRKGNPLMSAPEAIRTSKQYLERLGYRNFKIT
ncbi:sugar phosphate isomerase/epimerase family protein [Paenibacillus sp. PL91]|uniref:sugar phosphate isomerase/epimerase family protein n=1 Tax=Paenibacillus sp. PL91 TaxID=2729538 RepID=UPI00145CB9B6|nr:sugar phosphate isomerase/epimerase [Paenibacillus sp. PL91]MBC9200724.1 TIM barrel protein [Paenibacillus sp. PL91]